MKIPVDGICLEANELKCDESAMTGESDHLKKDTVEVCLKKMEEFEVENKTRKNEVKADPHEIPSPLLMSGTAIRKSLEAEQGETPLQIKLTKIASDIGKVGTFFAIFTIHILLARYLCEGLIDRKIDLFGGELDAGRLLLLNFKIWVEYFIIGVAVVVVAVPEGLPLAVMISLAYSIGKMAKDHNDVKKLASCEIMGGADNICSDKTGTLTENIMKVTKIWCGKVITIS